MAKLEVTVTDELNGARLDKAIVALVEGSSRARVKRAIEEGTVSVNGRIIAKGEIVKEGDRILVDPELGSVAAPCIAEPGAVAPVSSGPVVPAAAGENPASRSAPFDEPGF